ncbi:uncharacterized protein LOC135124787 [Zophobas morio]|uniref:uncharacterized protein LOC135124787 n=1 Tax=Zophobas morio TaxID=2755281 RepID=UPI003082B8B8
MWNVILVALAAGTAWGRPRGEHVCQEEHRFIVNVTESFLRNSTVRHYKWCMNVPPRCSFYTTKVINDSRIVEKEVTDVIDKCCSGYMEDITTGLCLPDCPGCSKGTCLAGECSCFPGYKGEMCNVDCEEFEWGEGCKFKCNCNGGGCDRFTGSCLCLPGWIGDECQSPCPAGFYGSLCQLRCPCEPCHPATGRCLPTSPSPPLSSPSPSSPPISFTNNGKLEVPQAALLSTPPPTEAPFPIFEDAQRREIDEMPINNYVSVGRDSLAETTEPVQITKSRTKVKSTEVSGGNGGNPEINKNDLVNSASAATAISAGIIIVAAVIVAANHFKRSRKAKDGERGKGVSTVAVYTHSIFHTPLPDPPIFENPIFVNPVETNPSGEGRFETHVVCSMNFPGHPNSKDFLYDHPPSTGSYRAASIPEPDLDLSHSVHSEPVYDEIPSGIAPIPISQPPPSYKSSSLYMNTCGKTRF